MNQKKIEFLHEAFEELQKKGNEHLLELKNYLEKIPLGTFVVFHKYILNTSIEFSIGHERFVLKLEVKWQKGAKSYYLKTHKLSENLHLYGTYFLTEITDLEIFGDFDELKFRTPKEKVVENYGKQNATVLGSLGSDYIFQVINYLAL